MESVQTMENALRACENHIASFSELERLQNENNKLKRENEFLRDNFNDPIFSVILFNIHHEKVDGYGGLNVYLKNDLKYLCEGEISTNKVVDLCQNFAKMGYFVTQWIPENNETSYEDGKCFMTVDWKVEDDGYPIGWNIFYDHHSQELSDWIKCENGWVRPNIDCPHCGPLRYLYAPPGKTSPSYQL